MSGITLDVDLTPLNARLARLAHQATHLRPALADIAEEIHNHDAERGDERLFHWDPQEKNMIYTFK